MMKSLLVLALISVIVMTQSDTDWEQYKKDFNKRYTPDEEVVRKGYWAADWQRIQQANSNPANQYTLAPNQFSDLSDEEKARLVGGVKITADVVARSTSAEVKVSAVTPPASLDWRTPCAITPIKNQGSCGDCWAFSSTAYIESKIYMMNNRTYNLSEEYLLSCTASNSSCNGGYVNDAMTLAKTNGMPEESRYPYTGLNTNYPTSGYKPNNANSTSMCSDTVRIQLPSTLTTVNQHYNNAAIDVGLTVAAVKTLLMDGPVPALVNADSGFMTYSTGTYSCATNTTTSLINHAVQLIGWTSNNSWIIKNSWGTTWGMSGYGYVNMDLASDCGLHLWLYSYTSTGSNLYSYNSSCNSTTNNTTNNTTKRVFEWHLGFTVLLALISLIVVM